MNSGQSVREAGEYIRKEIHADFVRLAERFERLLQHGWGLRQARDEAALRVAQLEGILMSAKAELAARQKAVDEDAEISRPICDFLLKKMEDHPRLRLDAAESDRSEDG